MIPARAEFEKHTIGKTVEEATKLVKDELGWELRVVKIDGKLLDLTPDIRDKRIGVGVENGIIAELLSIGS